MGVQNPNAPPATPAPKRFSLPPNFHTEVQNAAGTAVAQKKLQRAIAPLKSPTVDAHHQALQDHEAKRVVSDWRSHVRQTINNAVDQHGPRGIQIAATTLQHEASQAQDQLRLHSNALNPTLSTSHRLAAARELRTRYGLPMTTTQLLTPERMKNVNSFLAETDRHIARDNAPGAGGITPLAAATADFNPIHFGKFLHSVGDLTTAGANTVVGALDAAGGAQFGRVDVTPKILRKIGTNALKDALDIPAQTVVSGYDLGNAAYQYNVHGNKKPLQNVVKGTEQLLAHPTEHPLAAALVLRGGISALDKTAGGIVRTVTRGKIAGTGGRAPIDLYGKQKIERSYATGLGANAVQRVLDAKRPGAAIYNKFADPVRQARRELAAAENHRGRVAQPTEDMRQVADRIAAAKQTLAGRKVGKTEALPMLRDYHLTKRVDEASDTANALRSQAVIKARKDLRAALPRQLRSALRPAIEGTIKSPESAVADIKVELKRLQKEHDQMEANKEPRWRVRRNERQQHTFEKLLENKHFTDNPHPVFDAADKFIETQRQMESKLAEHGLLDPERALRSKLIPYAVRDMGAHYDEHSGTLVAEDGTPLPNEQIIEHMHANGVRFREPWHHAYDPAAGESPHPFPGMYAARDVSNYTDATTRTTSFTLKAGSRVHTLAGDELSPHGLPRQAALDRATAAGYDAARFRTPEGDDALVLLDSGAAVRGSGPHGEQPQIGFVSQRGDLGRLGDFFKDPTRQPSGYFAKRTGESAQKGLHNLHFKMIEAQLSHSVNILAQAEHANAVLDRFGLKPKGDIAYTDYAVADNAARLASDKTGMNWEVVKVGGSVGEQLRAIHEHIDPASVDMLPEHGQLPGKPNFLVMPSTIAERFREHANSLGSNSFQLGWQALTHAFRNTVLPLSPRWLAGNVVELAVRGAIAGTGPLSWAAGHGSLARLKMLDEGAYDHLMARAVPGANYATQVRLDHYQGIERYVNKGIAEHFAKALFNFMHHPASPGRYTVAPAVWLYSKYAHAIKVITPVVEKEFQKAALGKAALHELRDIHGSWLAAMPHWNAAINDVAHGLLETNNQLKFAEYVDKVVGRYNKLSPSMRNLVSGYAPFALWYVNAAKFVFVTMPKDHPILQGAIAGAYAANEPSRLKHEESLTYGAKHAPGFLQGTIPQSGGHNLPLNHYMPWGAFQDPENLQSIVLPQVNGLIALAGVNWKFKNLKGPPGTDMGSAQERLGIALNSVMESLIPGLAVARRLREQGGSAYDNSTLFSPKVRPGTKKGYLGADGSLRKTFDPFKSYPPGRPASTGSAPTPPRGPKLGGSSGGSGRPKLGTSTGGGVKLG